MSLKYGKALVGAVAAVTVSTFTVPFCATANASTGTTITRNDASSAMQLAQVEQQETEEKAEQKTKEVQGGAEVIPPGPAVAAPVVPGAVEQKHEESKTTETVNSNNGMGGTSERHENEMSNDSKMAPGSMEREHEEHQTSKTVEQNQ